MKHITKQKEPASLHEYRTKTPNASYPMPSSGEVKKSLLEEQGFICAYCMRRISLDRDPELSKPKVEIEHFCSQHRHPTLNLDYKNMLGVCNGNAGKANHKLICDKSKSAYDKTHDLTVDPLNINRIRPIKYSKTGEIFSETEAIDFDLNTILNLNEENLKQERANLYRNIKKKVRSFWGKTRGNKQQVKALLLKEQKQWEDRNNNNQFRELCALPLYVIEKELNKF